MLLPGAEITLQTPINALCNLIIIDCPMEEEYK